MLEGYLERSLARQTLIWPVVREYWRADELSWSKSGRLWMNLEQGNNGNPSFLVVLDDPQTLRNTKHSPSSIIGSLESRRTKIRSGRPVSGSCHLPPLCVSSTKEQRWNWHQRLLVAHHHLEVTNILDSVDSPSRNKFGTCSSQPSWSRP